MCCFAKERISKIRWIFIEVHCPIVYDTLYCGSLLNFRRHHENTDDTGYLNLGNTKLYYYFNVRFIKSWVTLMWKIQGVSSGKMYLMKETDMDIDKYDTKYDDLNGLSGTYINPPGILWREC